MMGTKRLATWPINYAELIIVGVFACAALLPLADRILILPLHVGPEYNEGWNAFHADVAMRGGTLYPDGTALTSNNYPPLSFYIVGTLGAVLGDNIIAGRIIALASLLVVAANIAFIVIRLGGSRGGAIMATLFFIGYHATQPQPHVYVALNDPQWLGHALMMCGFSLFVARKKSPVMLILAAAIMIAGGMVKHLLFAAPLAVTIWLAIYERRDFWRWIAAAGVIGVSALSVCHLLYGPNFLQGLLLAPRQVSLGLAASKINAWYAPFVVPAIGASIVAMYSPSRNTTLVLLFVLGGLLETILAIGGAGVNANAAFDLAIGLSIASGLAIDKVTNLGGAPARLLAIASLASFIVISAPAMLVVSKNRIHSLPYLKADWAAEIERIQSIDGPAACETPSLCYWSGKDFEMDFFNYGQKLTTGAISVSEGLAAVLGRKITAMQIVNVGNGTAASQMLPHEFNQVLAQHYVATPSRLGGAAVLMLKP